MKVGLSYAKNKNSNNIGFKHAFLREMLFAKLFSELRNGKKFCTQFLSML